MNLLYAALLGIIQGLTEFLPVSSSAHLILFRAVFGVDLGQIGLPFDVACHVGTLLAVVVYFRRELWAMVAESPVALRGGDSESVRLLRSMLIGTLPIAGAGLVFGDVIQDQLRTPGVAVLALALGGVVLLAVERVGPRARGEESLRLVEALAVGVAQAVALVPGVSRSGAVIAAGLLLGLRREAAARFGFLLGIPAILMAAAKAATDLSPGALSGEVLGVFAVGLTTSAVVGHVTVSHLIRYLTGHTLGAFAVYRLLVAGAVFLWMSWV
ncbi:MAG TPA: undecaprenyl-diphosphate phosphatase [Dehalococcoidia bacterium]|nr:undecaprenyl-diphosphate phosphatase [Dehalococcoidia bacterium]